MIRALSILVVLIGFLPAANWAQDIPEESKPIVANAVPQQPFSLRVDKSLVDKPLVIAHRGASGYLPEHTLEAYEMAIDMGADYVEPDLVFTKDGHLITRHDHYLSTSTDISDHPEFAGRKKTVDGRSDWYSEDFTLAEIKTLRARQAFRGRDQSRDNQLSIPTFQEVIDLVTRKSEETGRTIGIYPETKLPGWFKALNLDFVPVLMEQLEANSLAGLEAPVFIQSFEADILKQLSTITDTRLVQLLADNRSEGGQVVGSLEDIAGYADAVGPEASLLVNTDGSDSGFVSEAHALGMLVHPWTFRDDDYRDQYFPSADEELVFFLEKGIDGFFTDFPDTSVAVRNRHIRFQDRSDASQWVHFGGSQKGQQYSSLNKINPQNVSRLRIEWEYRTGELSQGAARAYSFQSNPILVNNKLYVSTSSGIVIALNPETGEQIWRHDPGLDRTRPPSEISNRGVTSWIDPVADRKKACWHRVYIGLLDSRLLALDGETGQLCQDFGKGGTIFLNEGVRLKEGRWLNYTITSPPVVVGDILISGSAIGDNSAVETELGIVRGYNARTGELKWIWDPIPRSSDDPAYGEWTPDQVEKTGAANAWAPLAADVERRLVFIPTGSASPDFYGGERKGSNLYANSLVALNAETGAMVWAQQLVHHDVWDYDLASQPTLVDLEKDGKKVPAVLQGTKTGHIFTFHRETGEPLFAINEVPVPQNGEAGEELSLTQPIPVAPPPLVRQGKVTSDDAWGLVLIDKLLCARELAKYRSEGIYTPPSIQGTIELPAWAGGINWGGLAFDPQSRTVVANVNDVAGLVALIPRDKFEKERASGEYPQSEYAAQEGTAFGMRRQPILSIFGAPCVSPPWGRLVAVDMDSGTIKWDVPLGTTEDLAPWPLDKLELGVPNMGGAIITAGGLVFIGASTDNYLRAFDLQTGQELWKGRLPAGGQATPMTYFLPSTGKQYVVIAAGGHPAIGTTPGDYVIAFSF